MKKEYPYYCPNCEENIYSFEVYQSQYITSNSTEQKIMDYVEAARNEYDLVTKKPIRYREDYELEVAQSRLIQIECLAMELGLINEGTI